MFGILDKIRELILRLKVWYILNSIKYHVNSLIGLELDARILAEKLIEFKMTKLYIMYSREIHRIVTKIEHAYRLWKSIEIEIPIVNNENNENEKKRKKLGKGKKKGKIIQI